MVAIFLQRRSIILCDQYNKLNGQYFKSLVEKEFKNMFSRAKKGGSKLWLQDNDPSQNSMQAKSALRKIGAKLFRIPARSPDINFIEFFFFI